MPQSKRCAASKKTTPSRNALCMTDTNAVTTNKGPYHALGAVLTFYFCFLNGHYIYFFSIHNPSQLILLASSTKASYI